MKGYNTLVEEGGPPITTDPQYNAMQQPPPPPYEPNHQLPFNPHYLAEPEWRPVTQYSTHQAPLASGLTANVYMGTPVYSSPVIVGRNKNCCYCCSLPSLLYGLILTMALWAIALKFIAIIK